MLKPTAEFRVVLPTGGTFYAAWPRSVSDADLRMVRAVLGQTLDWWIDALEQAKAGDLEYASWLPVAAVSSVAEVTMTMLPNDKAAASAFYEAEVEYLSWVPLGVVAPVRSQP
jgi:hypothetical protein